MSDMDVYVGLSPSISCQVVNRRCPMVAGESETADVIQRAECGIVAKPGDITGARPAILYLKELVVKFQIVNHS